MELGGQVSLVVLVCCVAVRVARCLHAKVTFTLQAALSRTVLHLNTIGARSQDTKCWYVSTHCAAHVLLAV